jgi:16S rRNA G966 N2-methylase RsmD
MSMPRPPTAHRHPHSNARQFDLFCDPPYATAQTPQWQALPAETRHTLTKLMVRLIFGHADGDLAREREEMRHDV